MGCSGSGEPASSDGPDAAQELDGLRAEVAALQEQLEESRTAQRESEERLRLIMRSAVDYAIITTDLEGRITGWNTGAENVLGHREEEVLGQDARLIFLREDRSAGAPEAEMSLALSKGRAQDERWHLRKDGSRFWATGLMMPLQDGEVRGFLKILRDQTEQRRAADALRDNEARFRTLTEAIPQLVWSARSGGRWTWASRQWVDYTGQLEPASHGQGWLDAVHPDDRDASVQAWVDAAATGRLDVEHRLRAGDGTFRWFQSRATPMPSVDADQDPLWFGTSTDVHDVRSVQDALRESETRFREFAEASEDVLWIIDAGTGRLKYLSPAYEAVWGEPRDAVMADVVRWRELVHPDDRETAATAGMPRLLRGERVEQEYRIVRPSDGAVRWIRDAGFPIRDADGRVSRAAGIARDVTARKLVEEALAVERGRFEVLVDSLPVGVGLIDRAGHVILDNPVFRRNHRERTIPGGEPEPHQQWTVYAPDGEVLQQDDWPVARALRGEVVDGIEASHRQPDGSLRWWRIGSVPVPSLGSEMSGALVLLVGIDEEKRAAARQRLLLDELNHRVKNTLATVLSLAAQTRRSAASPEAFDVAFQARLRALADAHDLLTRGAWERASLPDIVARTLAPHEATDGQRSRVTRSGPAVDLTPHAVVSLHMSLHELATNAAKYGALSSAAGTVVVTWKVTSDGQIEISWVERGGPPVSSSRRNGFGTYLLERGLAHEVDGEVTLSFDREGVRSLIRLPPSAAVG